MFAEKGRCTVADQGREALPVEADGACRVSDHGPGSYAAVHAETVLVVRWTARRMRESLVVIVDRCLSMAGIILGRIEKKARTKQSKMLYSDIDFGGK